MSWKNVKTSRSRLTNPHSRFSLRAEEVKEHPFFKDIDWKQVYLLKLTPPLIPPRGEVNAADAFDIGNFDEDDTKGIKVSQRERGRGEHRCDTRSRPLADDRS